MLIQTKAFVKNKAGGSSAAMAETEEVIPSHDAIMDNLEVQDTTTDENESTGDDEPVDEDKPPQQDNLVSPAHAPSPMEGNVNPISEPPLGKTHTDVVITGEKQSTPETSNIWQWYLTRKHLWRT